MNHKKLADQYRQNERPDLHGGVVVIFDDDVSGWMNELRDPQSWEPGCIAINEAGQKWISVGGNSYAGSERWEPVPDTESFSTFKSMGVGMSETLHMSTQLKNGTTLISGAVREELQEMKIGDNYKKNAAEHGPEQLARWQNGIILISGRAWGKSHIGRLLEKNYKAKGIPCRRRCCTELWELTENDLQLSENGFLIIETNLTRPEIVFTGLEIRQHIRLS